MTGARAPQVARQRNDDLIALAVGQADRQLENDASTSGAMLEERLHRWMPLPSEQRCGRDGRHRKVERGTHPRLFVGEGNWLGYSGVDPCVGVRVSTRCIGVRRYGGGTAQGSLQGFHKLLYYSILFSETAPVSRAPAPPRALPYLVGTRYTVSMPSPRPSRGRRRAAPRPAPQTAGPRTAAVHGGGAARGSACPPEERAAG